MQADQILAAVLPLWLACSGSGASATIERPAGSKATRYRGGDAPLSGAADRQMLAIEGGSFVAGSTPQEREQAYLDYRQTAGHDAARRGKWFDREEPRHLVELGAYRIDLTPVTNAAYAEFVADTGRAAPSIDEATWKKQGFNQDYANEVARFVWKDNQPPAGRADHPVVLVSWKDARDYCAWRGSMAGVRRFLPSAHQYEKAARGRSGLVYPWGNNFDPDKLNSQVKGPKDTMPVGSFPKGASSYGMLDAGGNVFQWTSTPWRRRKGAMTVKGSAWDDYGGLGRGAAQHGRRAWVKHAIVGFRCAGT